MPSVYRFADLTLDTGRYALERNGAPVDLPRLSFELLLSLVRAAPNVLTHEEIVEQVWKGRVVSPETVTQRIKLLRQALGDDAADPRYIVGIRGRGYQLIPRVEHPSATGQRLDRAYGRIVLAGAAALAAAVLLWFLGSRPGSDLDSSQPAASSGRDSVAVLPFQSLSHNPGDEYLAAGIHNEILTHLSRVSRLKVISRTSVMEYQDRPRNRRVIGKELGVASVLEGDVQRDGDRIRVHVRLVDVGTNRVLWGETYDARLTLESLLSIQTQTAVSVARMLRAALPTRHAAWREEMPTKSIKAYELYQSGNNFFHRPDDRRFMPQALEKYERAVSEDEHFALAWAALSRAHSLHYWYSIDASPVRLQWALDAANRALALDPHLSEAHIALGQYYQLGRRDYDRALEEYAVAEKGMGETSELYQMQAMAFRRKGDWDRAFDNFARAVLLDPRNVDLLVKQAATYLSCRDYSRAERIIGQALDIDANNAMAYLWKTWIPIDREGDVTLAREAAEDAPIELGRWRQLLGWQAALYERHYETALGYLDAWKLDRDLFSQQSFYIPKASYYGVTYRLMERDGVARKYFGKARAQLRQAIEENDQDARRHVSMAEALMGLGEREAAMREANRAMQLWPPEEDAMTGPTIQADVVKRVFAPLGESEAAIAALEAFLSVPGGGWSIDGLSRDPRFDPIRDDPAFQALVEKYTRKK
jgi:TolB-like protein/DNA-binding winged helix-turn-helix (wHTH) protein/Flp pilus assembly protein TadD